MYTSLEHTQMKMPEIFRSWLRRDSGSAEEWQEDVRNHLIELQARGVSRREIVERLARQMYAEDLQDLGSVADVGFLNWQLYLGDARSTVNYMLPDTKDTEGHHVTPRPVKEKSKKVA